MFTSWGRFVYARRRVVLAAITIALLLFGAFGFPGLASRLTQSGYDDPGSQSSQAAQLADSTFGRDHSSDILVIYTAPNGMTVDDPGFASKVESSLNHLKATHPDIIGGINSYWGTHLTSMADASKQHAFASIALTGNSDTQTLSQYQQLKGDFQIPGVKTEVAGLQPVGDAVGVGMNDDTHRAEVIALPVVAVLLFFVFGGVIAALLPVFIGVLTIAGASGVMWALTYVMNINTFAQPVVTLIGLGLAIDYGLFIVSRFREELADGYDAGAAVRRSVATAGRTVVFSATLLVVCMLGLLMFPQGFLKSVALGGVFSVAIAAFTSLTVLPALLGMLGRRVDSLSFSFLRRTKPKEEVERGFWARTTDWVMKHPVMVAAPIIVVLLLLIVPFKNIQFGGLSEKYLPPDNPTRVAQEHFDQMFPSFRTDPILLVVKGANSTQLGKILSAADKAPGFSDKFQIAQSTTNNVNEFKADLIDSQNPKASIEALRSIPVPDGVQVLVGGTPAITQDSIDTLGARLPWMVLFVVIVTTVLMFLAFGSLVLPIKAALMSALSLGSTLGILTWIFVDGHGSSIGNFTPGPLMAAIIPLMLAIIFGLSTDYEVFLLSRMVEARERGSSTVDAIRKGTAHTGRIITAAALILIVVTGAFAFSDIVMMKYIAYGMIAALILDATVIRMLLVPAIMRLLGDDCWWAPAWAKRIQKKIGLGEVELDDERGATRPAPRDAEPLTQAIPRITADLTPAFAAGAPERARPTRIPPKPPSPQPEARQAPPEAPEQRRQQQRLRLPEPEQPKPPHPSAPLPRRTTPATAKILTGARKSADSRSEPRQINWPGDDASLQTPRQERQEPLYPAWDSEPRRAEREKPAEQSDSGSTGRHHAVPEEERVSVSDLLRRNRE